MIVFLDMRTGQETYGDAYGHHGRRIGTWQQVSTWEVPSHRGMLFTDMQSVQVALEDGSEWSGSAKIAHPYRVRVHRKTGLDNQS